MKTVSAWYKIETPISEGGIQELRSLERVARTCYISEAKMDDTGDSAKRLVKTLIDSGHESILEHEHLRVRFICDRAISHEIVRHRMASYAQESQRYCNYLNERFGSDVTFIQPWWMDDDDIGYFTWKKACETAESAYFEMLNQGYSPQVARGVLPNCTKTEIVVTANYREWRHILSLRTDPKAHPDMVWLMNELLKELHGRIPIIFDDIAYAAGLTGKGVK